MARAGCCDVGDALQQLHVRVSECARFIHQTSARPPEGRSLSIAELGEHLRETEADIRGFSEELVQQLALRDELDFEKEVKTAFISALIEVQNRQKEQRELKKRKKRNPRGGAGSPQGSSEKSLASVSSLFQRRRHLMASPLRPSSSSASRLPSSALRRGGALLGHSEQLPADLWEQPQRTTGDPLSGASSSPPWVGKERMFFSLPHASPSLWDSI